MRHGCHAQLKDLSIRDSDILPTHFCDHRTVLPVRCDTSCPLPTLFEDDNLFDIPIQTLTGKTLVRAGTHRKQQSYILFEKEWYF